VPQSGTNGSAPKPPNVFSIVSDGSAAVTAQLTTGGASVGTPVIDVYASALRVSA